MKYRAWEKCKKALYIPKHFIRRLLWLSTPINLLWCHRFHSTTTVINTCRKKKSIQSTVPETFFSAQSHVSEPMSAKRGFSWQKAASLHPTGAIVQNLAVGTAKDSLWSLRASCHGAVAPRWVIENDMHRCSRGSVAGNQYNRLPSLNLSRRTFSTNFPQPDDARPHPPVNSEGSQKLYYSLSFSQEDTWGLREKRVRHLAGRASLYGCPIQLR